MRRSAFALAMLVLLTPLAAAQGDGFAAFWKEFSAAAAKKDKDKNSRTDAVSKRGTWERFRRDLESGLPAIDARLSRQGKAGAR